MQKNLQQEFQQSTITPYKEVLMLIDKALEALNKQSKTQKEVMLLSKEGKTDKEISNKLSLNQRQISSARNKSLDKLEDETGIERIDLKKIFLQSRSKFYKINKFMEEHPDYYLKMKLSDRQTKIVGLITSESRPYNFPELLTLTHLKKKNVETIKDKIDQKIDQYYKNNM